MNAQKIGYMYASLAAIMWGSTAAVTKLLLNHLTNFQVLFYSTLFASLTLLVVCVAQGRLSEIKRYTVRDYATFAFMGFVGVLLYRYFLQAALELMPAQEAFIINYTWPIMVVVFAWLILKERMTARKLLGLFLSFFGVIVVSTKGDFSVLSFSVGGVLFALAGAIAYGFYSALGKRQHYDKYTSTMFFYVFSFIYSAIFILGTSQVPALSAGQAGGLLWLGIFPSGLAFVFWLLALKHGDTAKISNLIFVTPFLSLVYIYFMLGEEILFSSVVGLVIIVVGILIQSITRLPRIKARPIPPEV